MVCVPCIVIPLCLWVFHRFIKPWVPQTWIQPFQDYVNSWWPKNLKPGDNETETKGKGDKLSCPFSSKDKANGVTNGAANGHVTEETLTAGDSNKKTD